MYTSINCSEDEQNDDQTPNYQQKIDLSQYIYPDYFNAIFELTANYLYNQTVFGYEYIHKNGSVYILIRENDKFNITKTVYFEMINLGEKYQTKDIYVLLSNNNKYKRYFKNIFSILDIIETKQEKGLYKFTI